MSDGTVFHALFAFFLFRTLAISRASFNLIVIFFPELSINYSFVGFMSLNHIVAYAMAVPNLIHYSMLVCDFSRGCPATFKHIPGQFIFLLIFVFACVFCLSFISEDKKKR